jgi:hypothetical protein
MLGSEHLVAKIIGKWQKHCYTYYGSAKFSPGLGEINGKMILTWNLAIILIHG